MTVRRLAAINWPETSRRKTSRKTSFHICCALLGIWAAWLPAEAQVTNFVLASAPQVFPQPWWVAAADWNGDGKLDLVSASPTDPSGGSGALTILTNNGSGGFGLNAVLRSPSYYPQDVTVADVNGDGKPDLITANFYGSLTVWTNNGSGVFGANATLNVTPEPDFVTVADVNGDGKPDLISVSANGYVNLPETLMIFTNNGSGFFGSNATLNVNATSDNMFPINVAAADVNGDGKPDLICPSPSAGAVEMWTNNGSGIFGSNATLSVGGSPDWVAVADVNDDGKPDIICANADNYLMVLTNNGNGVFGSNVTLSVKYPAFVTVGDVNEDGKPDLICASPGAGLVRGGIPGLPGDDTLTIFTNNGDGGFALDGKLAAGGAPSSVVVADINDDGQMDLICPSANEISTNNTLDIFANMIVPGHTGFQLVSSPGVGTAPASVAVADVNRDGKPDLISANEGTNTLTVLTNNGSGWFGSNATLSVGNAPACVVSTDVNGDSKSDLIAGNFNDGSLTILTNNGDGWFGSNATVNASPWLFSPPYPPRVEVYSIAAADITGDGKPDLIRANYNAESLTIFTNNGSGVLGSNATLMTYGSPRDIVLKDVNGDGKPDLICANNGPSGGLPSGSVVVLTNNGAGSVDPDAAQFFGPPSVSMAVGDINDNGEPDLVTADANDNLLRVWTNNGSGRFGSNATLSVVGIPLSVTLADVNRDGKPDVICTSYNSTATPGYLTVFTNNGSGVFGLDARLNVGAYPYDVVAADVNGDGRLDLITANDFSNDLSVLFNVPDVDMSRQTKGERLVWPYPSSGYALQQNANLGTTNWVDMTNTPDFIGGQNQVTLPPAAGNDFFRLMHP